MTSRTPSTPEGADSPVTQLEDALKAWRKTRPSAQRNAARIARQSPAGAEIQKLNKEWGQLKRENDQRIAPQREAYLARRRELLAILKAEAEKVTVPETAWAPRQNRVGRPIEELPDEIKILAYRASLTTSKGVVRALLGKDTEKLNRYLAEGKALASTDTSSSTDTEGGQW